jgi:hypothetical protein
MILSMICLMNVKAISFSQQRMPLTVFTLAIPSVPQYSPGPVLLTVPIAIRAHLEEAGAVGKFALEAVPCVFTLAFTCGGIAFPVTRAQPGVPADWRRYLCPKWALRIESGISEEFRIPTIRNTYCFCEILAKFPSNSCEIPQRPLRGQRYGRGNRLRTTETHDGWGALKEIQLRIERNQ